jgi:hypothetical protein
MFIHPRLRPSTAIVTNSPLDVALSNWGLGGVLGHKTVTGGLGGRPAVGNLSHQRRRAHRTSGPQSKVDFIGLGSMAAWRSPAVPLLCHSQLHYV